MPIAYPNTVKVARMAAVVTQAGTTAVLEIGTTGMASVLATINLGNPIAGAATGAGVLTLTGFPRSDTNADATGTAAAARIRTATGGTDIITGLTVSGAAVAINTNALTAANGNVLNFAATTGVSVGQNISGTGIPAGTEVLAFTGTTVTMSQPSTAGVASGATVTFNGHITLDSVSITAGQTVTVNSAVFTHAV